MSQRKLKQAKDAKLPLTIKTSKGKYQASVMLVKSRDDLGRPKLLEFVPDDKTITLEGGEEFIIGYMPSELVSKKEQN